MFLYVKSFVYIPSRYTNVCPTRDIIQFHLFLRTALIGFQVWDDNWPDNCRQLKGRQGPQLIQIHLSIKTVSSLCAMPAHSWIIPINIYLFIRKTCRGTRILDSSFLVLILRPALFFTMYTEGNSTRDDNKIQADRTSCFILNSLCFL